MGLRAYWEEIDDCEEVLQLLGFCEDYLLEISSQFSSKILRVSSLISINPRYFLAISSQFHNFMKLRGNYEEIKRFFCADILKAF